MPGAHFSGRTGRFLIHWGRKYEDLVDGGGIVTSVDQILGSYEKALLDFLQFYIRFQPDTGSVLFQGCLSGYPLPLCYIQSTAPRHSLSSAFDRAFTSAPHFHALAPASHPYTHSDYNVYTHPVGLLDEARTVGKG